MTPDGTEKAYAPKQESCLSTPVCLITIQHIRHSNCADDIEEGLDGGGQRDGLCSQTCGRYFGNNNEADWSDCHLVYKCPST